MQLLDGAQNRAPLDISQGCDDLHCRPIMGRGVSDVSAVSSASSQPARKLCTSGGKSATYRTEPEERATARRIAFSSFRLLPGQSYWIIRSRASSERVRA